jgi:hypothetical protein
MPSDLSLILQVVLTEQLIGWQAAELLTSPVLKGTLEASRKVGIPNGSSGNFSPMRALRCV